MPGWASKSSMEGKHGPSPGLGLGLGRSPGAGTNRRGGAHGVELDLVDQLVDRLQLRAAYP